MTAGLADIVGAGGLTEAAGGAGAHPVVRPADTEQLQAVVKWANETGTPLVPVSSGAPHCHDGASPGVEGAVIVDLSGMDRILRVDAANRVVIVEPGVTYGRLQSELAGSGLSAYMPLLPRASKSVLAGVLDRDPIVMPAAHFDSTDPMLCTEVVLGTGDRMRTGEAAGPDSLEDQWQLGKAQISPFGPTQMDIQRLLSGAQGTLGIVTWMSLKCRFVSDMARSFFVPGADLEPLIDLSYHLTRIRFSGDLFVVDATELAAMLRRAPGEIAALRDDLPPWTLFVSCEGYGPLPEHKVEYLEADLREAAQARGLEVVAALAGASADELSDLLTRPSPGPYWRHRLRGACSDIFFLTTQDKTPAFAATIAAQTAERGFPAGDLGVYIQPVVQGTSCHCQFDLFHDPADPVATEAVTHLAAHAAAELEAQGAFFSRPYGVWRDLAYRRHGDTAGIQAKVKQIFDPRGILNPGKLPSAPPTTAPRQR